MVFLKHAVIDRNQSLCCATSSTYDLLMVSVPNPRKGRKNRNQYRNQSDHSHDKDRDMTVLHVRRNENNLKYKPHEPRNGTC